MTMMKKGAALAALAALGLGLSACGNGSKDADAMATPDAADLTAASLDAEIAAMPTEAVPTDAATGTPSDAASAAAAN